MHSVGWAQSRLRKVGQNLFDGCSNFASGYSSFNARVRLSVTILSDFLLLHSHEFCLVLCLLKQLACFLWKRLHDVIEIALWHYIEFAIVFSDSCLSSQSIAKQSQLPEMSSCKEFAESFALNRRECHTALLDEIAAGCHISFQI